MEGLIAPRSLSEKKPLTEADTDSALNRTFMGMTGAMDKASGTGSGGEMSTMESIIALHAGDLNTADKGEGTKQPEEMSDSMRKMLALWRDEEYVSPRTGGTMAKAYDYVKDNLVAGAVTTINTASQFIAAPMVGLMGLGRLAMGHDAGKVAEWMERQYFQVHAKDPHAQKLAQESQGYIMEAMDKAIPAPFAYAYGMSAMNAGTMTKEQFADHMQKWGSLHGISQEWVKSQGGLEPQPVRDEAGNVVAWTQPEDLWWKAFGSSVIQIAPLVIVGEGIGIARAKSHGPLAGMPDAKGYAPWGKGGALRAQGKGYISSADLTRLQDMLKDPQFRTGMSTKSAALVEGKSLLEELRAAEREAASEAQVNAEGKPVTELAKEAGGWDIPDVTEGVDTVYEKPTPKIEGMEPTIIEPTKDYSRRGPGEGNYVPNASTEYLDRLNKKSEFIPEQTMESQVGTTDYSRPMAGEKPFTPKTSTAYLDRLNRQVQVDPKHPTPLPDAAVASTPSFIDARSGHEVPLYEDSYVAPTYVEIPTHRTGEPAKVHTDNGTFFRRRDGKYVQQGVENPTIFESLDALRTNKKVEAVEGKTETKKIIKPKKQAKGAKAEPTVEPETRPNPQGDDVILAPSYELLKAEKERLGHEEWTHRYNPLHQEARLIEKHMERGSSRRDAKILAREELRGYPTDYNRLFTGGMWKILGDKIRNHLISRKEAGQIAIKELKKQNLGEWEGDKLIVYHLTTERAAKNILKKGFLSGKDAIGRPTGISVSVNAKTATAMRRALDRMNSFKTHEAVDAWALENGANKADLAEVRAEYYKNIDRRAKQLREMERGGVTGKALEDAYAELAKRKQPGGWYLHMQAWLHPDMIEAGPYTGKLNLPKNEFLWNDMAMKLIGEEIKTVKSKLDLTKLSADELAGAGRLEYFLDPKYSGVEGEVRVHDTTGLQPTTFYTGGTYAKMGKGLKNIWDNATKGKIENNASADNPASLEAIRRLIQQRDVMVMRTNINKLNQFEPMIPTVDRVDIFAGKNELIIAKKVGDPRMIVLDAGPNLNRAQVKMALQHLHQKSAKGSLFADAASTMFSGAGWKFGAEAIRDIGRRFKDAELLNKAEDFLYIEPRFQRLGAHDTGFHAKNMNSYSASIMKQAAKRLISEAEAVGYDPRILQDSVLIAETPSLLKQYEGTPVGDFAAFIRREHDNARVVMQEHGINVNFKERITNTITTRLKDAVKVNDRAKIAKYQKALEKLADFEFVSIPKNMWFESMIENPKTESKALRILNATQRRILKISDMAPYLGDKINAMDVMASYYQKLANDLALAKIIKAGLKEGMITTDHAAAAKMGYTQLAGYEAPAFAKFYMHDVLAKTLRNEFIRKVNPNIVNQATSLAKMLTFDSPWYLGYYDIHQAAIRRGWQNLPGILKDSWEGYKMIRENHPEVQLAQENGLTSTPYPQPFEAAMKSIKDMHRGMPARIADIWKENLHPIKRLKEGKGFGKLPVIPEVYAVLWDAAWEMFDAPIRQGTYNWLRRQGLDPRNAAQTAALYHGDYAAVPRSTRVALNKIFYTPTFKIAMAKLHGRMIKEAIMGTGDLKYGNIGRRAAIGGIATILLTNTIFDQYMTKGLGFERESWGRRYAKDVETDKGIERFVMTLSHPQNLGPKYVEKVVNAFATKEPGKIDRLLRSAKYEFTPLLVIAWDTLQNQSPEGQIYNTYDDNMVKAKKMIGHGLRSISSWANSAFPTQDTKRTKEQFRKEVGAGIDILLGSVSNQYLGKPKYARLKRRMSNARANFKRDIARELDRKGELDPDTFDMLLKNYINDVEDVWK